MTDKRTQLFEAIRPLMPDQRFTPAMVKMVDDLADRAGLPRLGTDDWRPYALALIKQFEGCKLNAYADPASGGDPWTIGWGSTGADIKRGVVWTQEQADKRLTAHVALFAAGVDKLLAGATVSAAQKGALVSLAYNIGLGNLASSTLLKLHKAGEYADAAMQFGRWDKAAGKPMTGLARRRAAEAQVYRGATA